MQQAAAHTDFMETEAGRQRRMAWEAAQIAEARAELDAGVYVAADEVKAWLDSIGTDQARPVPRPVCARP